VTDVNTILFLYQNHHPEDSRITGRTTLVKILYIRIYHNIKEHLLAVFTLYKSNYSTEYETYFDSTYNTYNEDIT
jgi:hypothetical protein